MTNTTLEIILAALSERALDSMTDDVAEVYLDVVHGLSPDTTAAVEASTLEASPLAGPVRILREVVSVLKS